MTTRSKVQGEAAEEGGAAEAEQLMTDAEFNEAIKARMRRGVIIASVGFAVMAAAPGVYFLAELASRKAPEHAVPCVGRTWKAADGSGAQLEFTKRNVCKYKDISGAALETGTGPVSFEDGGFEVGFAKALGMNRFEVSEWPHLDADGRYRMTVQGIEFVSANDEDD